MWNFRLTVFGLLLVTDARRTYEDDRLKCVERARSDYEKLEKAVKIKVNGKLLVPNGFNESYAIVDLSVSRSAVQLPMLDINYNNLLLLDSSFNGLENVDAIGNETFPSLRLFNLSHNALSSVRSPLFTHLKELEILDLSHNCFVEFQYDHVFLQHENLKRLYLHHNRLHTIQSTFHEPQALTLQFLDISHNFIEQFTNYEIQIKHLNAEHNSLRGLAVFHAEGMVLNAQHNKIEHVYAPRGTFRVLNLSHNNLQYLSSVEIEEATVLDLSWNGLSRWASSDYYESASITEDWTSTAESFDISAMKVAVQQQIGIKAQFISLAHNEIDSLADLRHFRDYIELDLEANKLRRFTTESLRKLSPHLEKLILIDNSFTRASLDQLQELKKNLSAKVDIVLEKPPATISPLLVVPLVVIPTVPHRATQTTTERREKSTTEVRTTTRNTKRTHVETTTHASTSTRRVKPDEHELKPKFVDEGNFPAWIFAIICAAILAATIIFLAYREHRKSVNILYRNFNEAENFL